MVDDKPSGVRNRSDGYNSDISIKMLIEHAPLLRVGSLSGDEEGRFVHPLFDALA